MIRALFRYLGPVCLFCSATLLGQSFKNPQIIPTGTDPLAVIMADVNADGHPDLLYVESNYNGGSLHVLSGSATGTFQRTQDVPLPSGVCYLSCYIVIGEVNGDGIPDIVLNAQPVGQNATGGTVAALLGNGDGTFQSPIVSTFTTSSFQTLTSTGRIAIGDVNGDGAADLAIPDPMNGQVHILLGDKSGHFHLGTPVSDTTYPIRAILRDLNGDGHLDLLTLPAISGTAFVAFGKGDGTFATPTTYSTGYLPPVFHDMDGDGIPDLVFANADTTNQVYNLVVSKGSSDGTFAAATPLTSIPFQQLLDIGDYSGNGRADLLISMPAGFGVYPRKSDGTYSPLLQTVATTVGRSSIGALGDINSDGHPDMAIAVPGGIAVLLGNGDGSFQSADLYDLGHLVNSAALVKFSGSSTVDIAVQQPATFPRLLLGNGSGAFTLGPDPNSSYATTNSSSSLLAGDFNGDSNSDIFETPFQSTPPSVLFGISSGSLATPTPVATTAQIVADLNNDGRADLVFVDSTGVTVQLGQSNNTFTKVTTPPRVTTFAAPVAVGDLNGDSKPDLIVSTESGLDIYLGNGSGTFTFSNQILEPTLQISGYPNYLASAIADITGDGKSDLVFVSHGTLVLLPGNGDGTFAAPKFISLQHSYTTLQVADVNRDGNPDLVLSNANANPSTNTLAVLINAGGGAFGAEEPYLAGTSIGIPVVGDLNGDGYPDIVVPNDGGTTVTVLLNKGTHAPNTLLATLLVSPEPSAYAQPITVTLTTSAQPQPTGTVTFFADSQLLGSAAFSSGNAQLAYSGTLAPGSHGITAAYSGDSNYTSSSFTSPHTVADQTFATSTTLTATPAAPLASQTVRLVAKVAVAGAGAIPNGSVLFQEGTLTLGTGLVDSTGTAFLDTSILSVGTHSIVANFLGALTSNYPLPTMISPSSSLPLQVIVNALPTTTTLSADSATGTAGTVLSFTATVVSAAGNPFGGVTFFDGTQSLGTVALTGNQAVFSTASLPTGSHSIAARFNANGNFASSSSLVAAITVHTAKPGLAMTATTVQAESLPNGSANLIATVSPASAGGAVTFMADGVLIGSAPVNAIGVAQLSGFAVNGTIHSITASLTPSANFAPSASPQSFNGWSSNGPDFALGISEPLVAVQPGRSAVLQLSATGVTQLTGSVTLACILPEDSGYICSLGATSLAYGQTTTVTIATPSPTTRRSSAYLACVLAALLLPLRRRRPLAVLAVLLLCTSAALVGCGSTAPTLSAAPAVARIQATSTSSNPTVRTLQVFVNPNSSGTGVTIPR